MFASDMFEQFNARQIHSIILNYMREHVDIDYLTKRHVILDHFPMHHKDRETVTESWDKYKVRLTKGFIFTGFKDNMQPLNFIADYYGEKYGFYFSWLVHYTGQLIIPSIVGLGILIWQIVDMIQDGVAAKDVPAALNTTKNVWYAIFLMFWTTWLVESWKRKESLIAHQWLMRDFRDSTTERSEFKYALDLDVHTKQKWGKSVRNTYARTICIGIPVSALFIAMVVGVQVLQRWWRLYNDEYYDVDNGGSIPLHYKFAPSVVNSVAIGVFGATYKIVALKLVNSENHRENMSFENSLINKIYMFQFINAYISTYLLCFWTKDFYNAMYNLVIVIVCM